MGTKSTNASVFLGHKVPHRELQAMKLKRQEEGSAGICEYMSWSCVPGALSRGQLEGFKNRRAMVNIVSLKYHSGCHMEHAFG